jgi:hypothetical protein
MDRELKFRVCDKSAKTMHDVGFLLIGHGATGYSHPTVGEEASVGTEDTNRVLMQFTGLKDKNGKEIYEGGLRISDKHYVDQNEPLIRKVLFESRPPACGFILRDAEHDYIEHFGRIMKDDDTDWDVEVIGNIYENPELLETVETP